MIHIELTKEEIDYANKIAEFRFNLLVSHPQYKDSDAPLDAQKGLKIRQEGAYGEFAFAKFRRILWQPRMPSFDVILAKKLVKKPIIALIDNFAVRTTPLKNGKLIITEDDPDEINYALVLLDTFPMCRIAGWYNGFEAKQKGEHHDFYKVKGYLIYQGWLNNFEAVT